MSKVRLTENKKLSQRNNLPTKVKFLNPKAMNKKRQKLFFDRSRNIYRYIKNIDVNAVIRIPTYRRRILLSNPLCHSNLWSFWQWSVKSLKMMARQWMKPWPSAWKFFCPRRTAETNYSKLKRNVINSSNKRDKQLFGMHNFFKFVERCGSEK